MDRVRPHASECGHPDRPFQRHPCWFDSRSSSPSLRVSGLRSGRVPRESLDAPEDLPKEGPRQMALGKLQDEVPDMPDEAPTGLEHPLLQARQGPALNGTGQDQPA